jgi:hypothetical protein
MYCLFCDVLFIVCMSICVLNYCHRVATQLQLNIYHILCVCARVCACERAYVSDEHTVSIFRVVQAQKL